MTDEELLAYRAEVSRLLAKTVDLEADRDRARDAAVALEQEVGEIAKLAEAMKDRAAKTVHGDDYERGYNQAWSLAATAIQQVLGSGEAL